MTKRIVRLTAFACTLALLMCLVPLTPPPSIASATTLPAKAQLNVPYMSQHYNIPIGFSPSRACGITSAAMLFAYYGRIAPFTITGADGNPTDYGWYMTRAYRYKSPYHDVMWKYFANQEHRPGLQGWGAWGFIWRNGTDKTIADVIPFLNAHDISAQFIRQPSESYAKTLVMQEIAAGRPLMANTEIIGGHYVVIYGYDNTGEQFKYLVNDPWNGRKAYTYEELMVSQMYRGLILTAPANGFTARVPYSPGMGAAKSYVKPLRGSAAAPSTLYTYQLPLVVPEKVTPTVMVYIDGKPHKMQLVEGTTYTGTYQYKTTLEAGNHNYYFVVTTPRYTVWFPPDSGVWGQSQALSQFNGPFIEGAKQTTGTTLELQVMNDKYLINGVPNFMDMPPIIKSGRTLLPISHVVKALGGNTVWDKEKQKVTITMEGTKSATTVELWIGKNYAMVNGVKKPIDLSSPNVVPIIVNSRTMVPLRFVVETLGAAITWNDSAKVITITYQKQ